MQVYEKRASVILFNFLHSLPRQGIFLIPANVCPIVVATFLKARHPFEFIDIAPTTLCIDEQQTLAKLRENPQRYVGVHFVRTYGVRHSYDHFFSEIRAVAHSTIVIDDRCLCLPSFDATSSLADLILYSTGYSKYVDIGFGGFGWVAEHLRYQTHKLPYNSADLDRLTLSFKEAIKSQKQLSYQDSNWLDTSPPHISWEQYINTVTRSLSHASTLKAKLNHIYATALPLSVQLPDDYQAWRFNISVPKKHLLLKAIFDHGLFASSHYAPATGIFTPDPFPNAQGLYSTIVNLFNDFRFDSNKALHTVNLITDHLRSS